jgi:hypothetical protein
MNLLFVFVFLEPRMENWMQDVEERIQHGVDLGKKSGFIKSGQPIVCITGKEIEIIHRLFLKVFFFQKVRFVFKISNTKYSKKPS